MRHFTWYIPSQWNPVHLSLVVQFACPWFCSGRVLFSSLAHIWHSGRSEGRVREESPSSPAAEDPDHNSRTNRSGDLPETEK